MKSLQHVLWRGALALSLVAIGIGSGLGMPPAQRLALIDDCAGKAPPPVAGSAMDATSAGQSRRSAGLLALRRRLNPAG